MVSGLLTQVQAIATGMLTRARESKQCRRHHLEWQRHHREKDADGAPKSKASTLRLPHFTSKETIAQLTMQPCAPHMLDPRQCRK